MTREELLKLPPNQWRVIVEADELSYRMKKLEESINSNPLFSKLEELDQSLMKEQLFYMQGYHAVLEWRIKRF